MADTTRKERVSKPSVASHPLFPVVVVLWFGALFGLASLAIRPALIEGLVSATGIDQVIPMAAPPLGTTARILIALMMTLLGFIAGAIVARRFAKPAAPVASTRRRRPATTVQAEEGPTPVALAGADASECADQADEDQPARRRRQLAITDTGESFDDHAPLPGSTQILSVAELPLKSFDEVDGIWLHSSDRAERPANTFDVSKGAQDRVEEHEADQQASPAVTHAIASDDIDADAEGRSNRLFETYVRRVNVGIGSNDPDAPAPGFVSVLDGEAHATHEHRDEPDAPRAADIHTGAEPSVDPAYANVDPAYANTAERIAAAPLDTLSHVELLERLALTIARRRLEAAQQSPAPVMSAPAEPVWFSAPQTVAASGDMPASLRPHWMDADDEDEALPAIVPPRTMRSKADPEADAVADVTTQGVAVRMDEVTPGEDPQLLAEGYSSLLGMTKPSVRQVFGKSGAPDPATVSPLPTARAFDAPQSGEPLPDQTEQALRAALATLRRMSGAA